MLSTYLDVFSRASVFEPSVEGSIEAGVGRGGRDSNPRQREPGHQGDESQLGRSHVGRLRNLEMGSPRFEAVSWMN